MSTKEDQQRLSSLIASIDDFNSKSVSAEITRLQEEIERKSAAIQRLWKERDELRSDIETLEREAQLMRARNERLQDEVSRLEALLRHGPTRAGQMDGNR